MLLNIYGIFFFKLTSVFNDFSNNVFFIQTNKLCSNSPWQNDMISASKSLSWIRTLDFCSKVWTPNSESNSSKSKRLMSRSGSSNLQRKCCMDIKSAANRCSPDSLLVCFNVVISFATNKTSFENMSTILKNELSNCILITGLFKRVPESCINLK